MFMSLFGSKKLCNLLCQPDKLLGCLAAPEYRAACAYIRLSGVCHFLPPSHLLSLNRGEFIASQLPQVIVTQFQRALRPNLAGHCDLP